jgi:hypothetical protein
MIVMPPQDTYVRFANHKNLQESPFVIYADFEALTKPYEGVQPQQGGAKPKTTIYQKHEPCSFGLKLVSRHPDFPSPRYITYTGLDVVVRFLAAIQKMEARCMGFFNDTRRMIFTEDDAQRHEAATNCYLCHGQFSEAAIGAGLSKFSKVRDHDHITGLYRGAAHNTCNVSLRMQIKLNVFFHNLKGYDEHLLVHGFPKFDYEVSVIGQTIEKYMVINWGKHIVFKDSYLFMAAALDKLAKNLLASAPTLNDKIKAFANIYKEYNGYTQEKIDLLLRKGKMPYDWVNSWERLQATALPERTAFTSELSGEECSESEYEFAQSEWREIGCTTIQDYLDI